jgi:hypothetical protein
MAADIVGARTCRKCGALFLPPRCKECVKANHKANAERIAAKNAEWRKANADWVRERGRAYYAANADRILASKAKERQENPEKLRERYAAWCAANPDKKRASFAAWAAANRDKRARDLAEYRQKNADRVAAQRAEWNANNPERVRVHKMNRRLRELGGQLSTDLAKRLYKLQRGKCACCGLPLDDGYHLDHILPLALGGTNTDDNIQLLRPKCNFEKHAKHPVDFMRSRGRLL